MKKQRIILLAVVAALLSFISIENSYSQTVVRVKPTRTKVVVVKPANPGKNYVWVEGDWKWSKKRHDYVWKEGHWAQKPKNKKRWVAGNWNKVRGGWKYTPGRWI